MKRAPAVVAMFIVLSALAACGDDDETTEAKGAVTKAQYVEQANAVCTRVTTELNKLLEEGFPVVQSQVPGFITELAPIVTKGMGDLGGIDPPKDDEARVAGFRREAEQVGARWQKASTDEAEARKIFQEEGGFEAFQNEAKGYGLTACEQLSEESEGQGEHQENKPVDPATFSPEKRAYVEKIDAICTKADEEDKKIEEEVFGEQFPPTIDKWAAGLPRFAALSRQRLADIKKVTPPADDKAKIDALVAKNEKLTAELDQAANLAKAGNEQALAPVLQKLFPQFDEFDAELRAYGFQVCGADHHDDDDD